MARLLRLKRLRERLRMCELNAHRHALAVAQEALEQTLQAKQRAEKQRRTAEAVIDEGLRSRPHLPRELDEILIHLTAMDMDCRNHAERLTAAQARRHAASEACEASREAYGWAVRESAKVAHVVIATERQHQRRAEARAELELEPPIRPPGDAPGPTLPDRP